MNNQRTIKFFKSLEEAMSYGLEDYSIAFRNSIEDFRQPILEIKRDNRVFPAFCAFHMGEHEIYYCCAFLTKEQISEPVYIEGCNSVAYWSTGKYDPSYNGMFGGSSFPILAVPLASGKND